MLNLTVTEVQEGKIPWFYPKRLNYKSTIVDVIKVRQRHSNIELYQQSEIRMYINVLCNQWSPCNQRFLKSTTNHNNI